MNCELTRNVKQKLFFVALAFFFGIYIGTSTVKKQYAEERNRSAQITRNCVEVIIGKRPKKKLCDFNLNYSKSKEDS